MPDPELEAEARHLEETLHPVSVEPANFVKGSPRLGCLVDVDLAGLLRICLAEFLARAQALEAALKDTAFVSKIGSAVESQVASQRYFVWVQQLGVRVAAEVNWLALPVDLEAVGATGKRVNGRAVVGKRVKVLVFAIGSDDTTRRLWRGAGAASSGSWSDAARCRSDAIAGRSRARRMRNWPRASRTS